MSRTIFLAGGTGFIGTEFCRTCIAAGDKVLALSRSPESARKLQMLGITPVQGDLLVAGSWQDKVRAAEYVVQLAQPRFAFRRFTSKRVKRYKREATSMSANLLNALDPQKIKRVIYVSGACYYGNTGINLCDETTTPKPCGLGRLTVEEIEQVGLFQKKGMPILVVFPGTVYGAGSWFEELFYTPLIRGKRIITISGHSPFVSPIHVQDCASAIAHLLTHGSAGQRYFLVDDNPVQWSTLQTLAAQAIKVKPKYLVLPRWLIPISMGRIMSENLLYMDNVLSNAKLKSTGFEFRYPTVEIGIPEAVAQLQTS